MKSKQKLDQEEANKQLVEPLQKASEEVKHLKKKKLKHTRIMEALGDTQSQIMDHDSVLKEIEW